MSEKILHATGESFIPDRDNQRNSDKVCYNPKGQHVFKYFQIPQPCIILIKVTI